ncbi:MAG: HlyD family efflux transporter periplasmic adaptor subunit, partial [Eubacteriales bacterium]|nr:HlyD family efflux transporter periplasmic adaptor subunit [Eubacteriales bacterium]
MEELHSEETVFNGEEQSTKPKKRTLFSKRAKSAKREKKEQEPKSAKKQKKRKRRIIIISVIAAIVLLFVILNAIGQAQLKQMMQTVAFADTVTLGYGDIENAVSATGTVESDDSHTVYSTQSYQVKSVDVEVGDVVQEGDILCELDAEALEDQIKKLEITAGISAEGAAQQVKVAKDNYSATKDTIDTGTNSTLISAESAMETAYINWQNAQRAYQNYYNTNGGSANLVSVNAAVRNAEAAKNSAATNKNSAEAALNAAKAANAAYTPSISASDAQDAMNMAWGIVDPNGTDNLFKKREAAYTAYMTGPTADTQANYEAAQRAYDTAYAEYEQKKAVYDAVQQGQSVDTKSLELQAAVNAAQAAYDTAAAAYSSASDAYSDACRQRDAAYDSSSNGLTDAAQAVETARINYENSIASYNAVVASLENQLETGKNAIKTAEISAKNDATVFELANLQESLEDTRIKAPASGTVTAVFASVGQSGAGVLFVIEDTQNLIVKTSVKEYDVGTVQVGMPVTIKSDATGSEVFEGVVASIAPTSAKTAQGATNTAGEVTFATEVAVKSKNTPLRIGMNVRLNYIVEQQEHVLTVPYDAVYENAAGQTCVLVLQDIGEGKYMVNERAVTLGVE